MKKILLVFLFFHLIISNAFAVDIIDLWDMLRGIYDKQGAQLDHLRRIEESNSDIKEISDDISSKATKQIQAMTGNYEMGELLNSRSMQKERLWSANDWQAMLNQASGGNTDRFRQLMQTYKEQYPELARTDIVNDEENNIKAKFYTETAQTSRATMAASVYSYEKINDQIRNMQSLLTEIDKAPNQKAAIDLNSRINVELGFIQLQLLKLQTLQTQLLAMTSQDKTNGMTVDAQFIRWK